MIKMERLLSAAGLCWVLIWLPLSLEKQRALNEFKGREPAGGGPRNTPCEGQSRKVAIISSEKGTPRQRNAAFKSLKSKNCHEEERLDFIVGVPGLDLG